MTAALVLLSALAGGGLVLLAVTVGQRTQADGMVAVMREQRLSARDTNGLTAEPTRPVEARRSIYDETPVPHRVPSRRLRAVTPDGTPSPGGNHPARRAVTRRSEDWPGGVT